MEIRSGEAAATARQDEPDPSTRHGSAHMGRGSGKAVAAAAYPSARPQARLMGQGGDALVIAPARAGSTMSPSMNRWLRERVRVLWGAATSSGPRRLRSVAPQTTLDRVDAVVRCYRELWALGYQLREVEGLGSRHLKALLEHWTGKGLAESTLRVRWSHLASWCAVIGKPGMAPPFASAKRWLPVSSPPTAADGPDPMTEASAVGVERTAQPLRRLDAAQYERLLAILDRRFDRTGYWLVRCVRELRLSRKEAVLFEPAVSLGFRDLGETPRRTVRADVPETADLHARTCAASLDVAPDVVLVWSAKGRAQRLVAVDTRERRVLVSAVLAWMAERGRKRLGWHDMSVTEMTKRYTNLLGYALKQMRLGGQDVVPESEAPLSDAPGVGLADLGEHGFGRASALTVADANAERGGH